MTSSNSYKSTGIVNVSDNPGTWVQISITEGNNWYAFAALKNDGSVVTWGKPESGGNSSVVSDKLNNGVKH